LKSLSEMSGGSEILSGYAIDFGYAVIQTSTYLFS
jgi:hypothetical protein